MPTSRKSKSASTTGPNVTNSRRVLALLWVLLLRVTPSQARLEIRLQPPSDPEDALNDTTPAEAVGSNGGATLGEQRWQAIEMASEAWAARLSGAVPVLVSVSMPDLACGTLGGAQSNGYVTEGPGLSSSQVYSYALAERLAGESLNGDAADIVLELNGADCAAQGPNFYLGLDAPAPDGMQSLVNLVAHELAHGLGFESLVNPSDGTALFEQPDLDPFSRHLYDTTTDSFWYQLTPLQRATSATTPRSLVWIGPEVSAAAKAWLALGSPVLDAPDLPQFRGILTAPTNLSAFDPIETTIISIAPATACEAIADSSGQIVLAAEGECSPAELAQWGHDAGALAVLEVEGGGQLPAPSFATREQRSDPALAIPVLRIGQADGQLLADNAGLTVSLTWDSARRAGTDHLGRPYVYTPSKPVLGQSLSHWDSSLSPSALLEPVPALDTPLLDLDLELAVLRELGWTADEEALDAGVTVGVDGSSVADRTDEAEAATNPRRTTDTDAGNSVSAGGATSGALGPAQGEAGSMQSASTGRSSRSNDAASHTADAGAHSGDAVSFPPGASVDTEASIVEGESFYDASRHAASSVASSALDAGSAQDGSQISPNCGCSTPGRRVPRNPETVSILVVALLQFARFGNGRRVGGVGVKRHTH